MVVILTPTWNHQFLLVGRKCCLLFGSYVQHSGSQSVQAPSQIIGPSSDIQGIQPKRGCEFSRRIFVDAMLHLSGIVCQTAKGGIYSIQIRVTSKGAMLLPLVGCLNSASQSLSAIRKQEISWKTWENYGKPISDHGHDMMHSPWTFVATLVWFIPMLPEAPSGLNAQRSGNPFHQKRKVQRRHWGLFSHKTGHGSRLPCLRDFCTVVSVEIQLSWRDPKLLTAH